MLLKVYSPLPQDQVHKCPAAMDLYNSLKQEQTAVLGFIMNADSVRNVFMQGRGAVLHFTCCPYLNKK